MKLTVRRFKKEDAKEVSYIVLGNLYDVNIVDYTKRQLHLVADRHSPQKILEKASDYELYIALTNDKIVGVIGLQENRIRTLFVDVDYHNQGIGKALVKMIEKLAVERKMRKIIVHSSLTAAPFYKRLGYIPREKILDDEIQVMKMEKKLQEIW